VAVLVAADNVGSCKVLLSGYVVYCVCRVYECVMCVCVVCECV